MSNQHAQHTAGCTPATSPATSAAASQTARHTASPIAGQAVDQAAGDGQSRTMGDTRRVLPSATEPLAKDFVSFLGGPPGKHAAIGGAAWWTPLRVILGVASFFLALGWLHKSPCLNTVVTENGPQLDLSGNRSFTTACYNDIIPLFGGRGLDQLAIPYFYSWVEDGQTRYMEYPVGTGMFQWVAAAMARGFHAPWTLLGLPEASPAGFYFGMTAVLLAAAWMCSIALLTKLTANRIWDTVVVAASPLVIVHAFTNWDILAITATMLGLFLWMKNKPGWAAIALSLGVSFKLWPIFVIGAIGLVCLRNRDWTKAVMLTVGSVGGWLAANLPFMLLAPAGWSEFFRMNSDRGYEGSTIYRVISDALRFGFGTENPLYLQIIRAEVLNVLSFGGLALALAGLIYLVLVKAPQTPRIGQVAFLAVAAFLLFNKVWSPQFSLWLLPLMVLALPRWNIVYTWATTEAVYWFLRMWEFLPEGQRPPEFLVDVMTVLRIALILWLVIGTIRHILQPEQDPIRQASGGHDPLAPTVAAASLTIAEPAPKAPASNETTAVPAATGNQDDSTNEVTQ